MAKRSFGRPGNGKKITQTPREEEQLEGCKALGKLENVKIEGLEHELDEMQAKRGDGENIGFGG